VPGRIGFGGTTCAMNSLHAFRRPKNRAEKKKKVQISNRRHPAGGKKKTAGIWRNKCPLLVGQEVSPSARKEGEDVNGASKRSSRVSRTPTRNTPTTERKQKKGGKRISTVAPGQRVQIQPRKFGPQEGGWKGRNQGHLPRRGRNNQSASKTGGV